MGTWMSMRHQNLSKELREQVLAGRRAVLGILQLVLTAHPTVEAPSPSVLGFPQAYSQSF